MLEDHIRRSEKVQVESQNENLRDENKRLNETIHKLMFQTMHLRSQTQVYQTPQSARSQPVEAVAYTPGFMHERMFSTATETNTVNASQSQVEKASKQEFDILRDQNQQLQELVLMIKLEQEKRNNACCSIF